MFIFPQITLQILLLQLAASALISSQLSLSLCQQREKYFQNRVIQPPAIFRPQRNNVKWFDLQNRGTRRVTFKNCAEIQPRYLPKNSTKFRSASARIVGGIEANMHEFPSIVLSYHFGKPHCGGTLIAPKWILTAAHCFLYEKVSDLAVAAGRHTDTQDEPDSQRREKLMKFPHPKFVLSNIYEYDIALLKVEEPFELNSFVQLATLPEKTYRANGVFIAAGWGRICDRDKNERCPRAEKLRKVDLPYVSDEECAARHKTSAKIPKDVICAGWLEEGGKDACDGDSGGPLYKIEGDVQTVVGVTSWGQGCAEPGYPGVWTETAYYIDWIEEIMQTNSD